LTGLAAGLSLQAAALEIAATANHAIERRGRAVLIWSGGNTPRRLMPYLAKSKLDWSRVSFILGDERWVPLDSAQSNEGEMRRYLAETPLQAASLTGLFTPGLEPAAGIAAAHERIADLLAEPADLSLLGVGDDGHIASLFPGQDWSAASPDDWLFAAPHPVTGETRISLTPAALWRSAKWLLLVTTPAKRAQWQRALAGSPPGETPVAIALDPRAPPVEIIGPDE
jgi:6-phosphogluconolactonase